MKGRHNQYSPSRPFCKTYDIIFRVDVHFFDNSKFKMNLTVRIFLIFTFKKFRINSFIFKRLAKIVQNNEFRFVGLSRSGNHAIINWVIRQLDGRYCFLNCTEPKFNPYFTSRPLSGEGKTYQTNIEDFALEKEQQMQFTQKDYLLYNHEDCFLGPLEKSGQSENIDSWVGGSRTRRDILIIRDPFNLFASRIRAGLIPSEYTPRGAKPTSILTLQRIYKQHAREFLGKKNYLKKNKIAINFNSWSTDKDYRRNFTDQLGIPFTDKGFREVADVAGGSSFDGLALSGNAHKMNIHSRWKQFASDKEYWALFDPEIIDLARKIFGEIPPLQFAQEHNKIVLPGNK